MDLFSSMNFESNTSQQTISISVAIQTHIAIFIFEIMVTNRKKKAQKLIKTIGRNLGFVKKHKS